MINWMSSYITRRREVQHEKERKWRVWIHRDMWLSMPLCLFRQSNWATWGSIQATVISRFRKQWPDTHVYIRFHTDPAWQGADRFTVLQIERAGTTKNKEQIFMIPDCGDQLVLEDILYGSAYGAFSRNIFILDNKPANWKETIMRLFEITAKLSDGQPTADFENELSNCRCICYSMDEDLVIAKADLPESTVISILEDVARENDLELVIERKNKS